MTHTRYMQAALSLARRNLGQTWPNPAVGAVIVKDGRILGTGFTSRGGRPHAEPQALEQAGTAARGATLYVTLEPCCHHGQTPPCTDAIIKAGIAACVIACRDPHPQVSGKGMAQLRASGIDVSEGVCEKDACEVNRGFFSVVEKKRPFVALKIASSQDGKITFPLPNPPPQAGEEEKKWITGKAARAYGHLLRSRYDAIATGIGTVLADDPLLTCRLPGLEDRSPVRVVFDRKGRLPQGSQLMKTANQVPVWPLAQATIAEALAALAAKGITRLLVEAGQALTTAFLQSGLVDRIYWFRAPDVIGSGGMEALRGNFPTARWSRIERLSLPPDSLEVLECSAA